MMSSASNSILLRLGWPLFPAGLSLAMCFLSSGFAANSAKLDVKLLPLPAIKALKTEPAALTLEDGRDVRKVLVWGQMENGQWVDTTLEATLKSESPVLAIEPDGFVSGKQKGEACLQVCVGSLCIMVPVKVKSADHPPIRFVKEVQPMLSRVGCNAGTCHGSAKGKNGFKLSLRGYDPEFDFNALVNDLAGRRFNRVAVDESLMLLKPTSEVPHEGRQVIKPGSREYRLLRQWIVEGTKMDDIPTAMTTGLKVLPERIEMDLPGRRQAMIVLAQYSDGSERDVTREAVFSSNNNEVAQVKDGVVTSLRRGEAAVLIRYEGNYATKEIMIMGDRAGFHWAAMPEYNFIDQAVNAKLQKMKILPSAECTDAEFIRRVSLDLTGLPPKPENVKAFLEDKTPGRAKREKAVDALIGSAEYVDFWANKWADLLQCNSENLGGKGVFAYRGWIHDRLASNKPYDQFVRELLTSKGSSYESPAVNYYRVLREPGKIAEDVSQTFLGVRFNCNKCHDHPFEKWTQSQYYEFGAFFARVAFKRGRMPGEEVVYNNYNGGEVQNPRTTMNVGAKAPFGKARDTAGDDDRRHAFVDWLASKENPLFAKSMANRMWSYFFGRGIIDPVDDIRGSNPPSNAALLDALAKDFEDSGFDLRKLMRRICASRTYQLSYITTEWNADDKVNFSRAQPRRLSAEQLMDAIAVATGKRPAVGGLPAGMRAVEAPDGNVPGGDFLTLFGRPKRQSACECERTSNFTLSHAMNLVNGPTVGEAVSAPDNRLKHIVDTQKDDKKVVEEIYYAVLCRPPTEKETALAPMGTSNRLEAAQDLAWALMNSPAFLFNR